MQSYPQKTGLLDFPEHMKKWQMLITKLIVSIFSHSFRIKCSNQWDKASCVIEKLIYAISSPLEVENGRKDFSQ